MTINLCFVGDGPRDKAAVPRLVERILNTPVVAIEFEAWKNLHLRGSGRGLAKKLLYMLIRARDRGAMGLVATLDADKADRGERLGELKATRDKDREKGRIMPAALGEAVPHLEAWLLDDDVAVRSAFDFAPDTQIEAPTKVKSPKETLDKYHTASKTTKAVVETLAEIAANLAVTHCARSGHTGFHAFCEEVNRELAPLCVD